VLYLVSQDCYIAQLGKHFRFCILYRIKTFPLQRLKDISISKKLYFIVGAMAVLIVVELLTLWFAIHTLSSVRALVGAEGLWSKAQKDAVYHLGKYYRTHDENDYKTFQKFMSVPLGDHKTRVELLKEHPDIEIARQGFLEGRVHPNDIDGMISLLRRFHNVSYIKKAIEYWTEGDLLIAQLIPIGEKLHEEIGLSSPSIEKLDQLIAAIDPLNERLTILEDNFSYTLGEGSRWLENIILKILFAVALTVEITGLILTISVSRGITKGLNEINKATTKIAKGDLSARATVFSKDEIGRVAGAVNQMTEKLVLSNKELEQFAFIASHDLQEPLRKIQTFADLILKNEYTALSDKGREYFQRMQVAAWRMKILIQDLLDYSRTGVSEQKLEKADLAKIVKEVENELQEMIHEKKGVVETTNLGKANINPSQFRQVISNLISNALKFSRPGVPPRIVIKSTIAEGGQLQNENPDLSGNRLSPNKNYCHISFTDNGIGFDPQYKDKIFEVFQRLHDETNYSGTGIGLAIVKKIVEHHGGIITATGEINKGASFDIYIPDSSTDSFSSVSI
jgi:two-component system, sensor histidine kinase